MFTDPPPEIRVDSDRPLRVHVVGTDEWAVDQAGSDLAARGHEVFRCHEPGNPEFPCNALRPDGTCPLDVGVDAVVTMRARPLPVPAVREMGVICQLHAGVPLVVGGLAAGTNPFEPWLACLVDADGDVAQAVRELAETPPLASSTVRPDGGGGG